MNELLRPVAGVVVPLGAIVVTLVGLWLAHSYRRQMALKLADTRRLAYARLWQITGLAAPVRLDASGEDGFLTLDERRALWAAMTDWYYARGNGMLLAETTKTVYLNAKHNLLCDAVQLRPYGVHSILVGDLKNIEIEDDRVRGILSVKQLSLLRTQLKSDLRVYGPTYSGRLKPHELFFLRCSGVDLRSRAWAKASGSTSRLVWLRNRFTRLGDIVRTKASGDLLTVEGRSCPEMQEGPWYEPEAVLDVDKEYAVPKASTQAVTDHGVTDLP